MRGRVFIISFFLGFCSYQTSPGSPWPPWPIKWNLDRNEYEDAVDIQRMVYIHFNCTCDYLTRCGKTPLVRYGYVDILHTKAKYQKRLCYNNDHSLICRRNKSLQTDRDWVVKALKDATNTRMIECVKPLFLNRMSHHLVRKRYKRSTFKEADIFFLSTKAVNATYRPMPTSSTKFHVDQPATTEHPAINKLVLTSIPPPPVTHPVFRTTRRRPTSTRKRKTTRTRAKTTKRTRKTTKVIPYESELGAPWRNRKFPEDYDETYFGPEQRNKPSTVFAAVLLTLVIANMVFVVLLIICLMLYLKVKRAEMMGSYRGERRFAKRSKHSSRRKSTKNSSAADGDDHLHRNGEKPTQSQKSLQDQGDKTAKNLKTPDAAIPFSPNEGIPQADEHTGIPLTVKNPSPKLAYQEHLDPPKMQRLPPKAPSRNVPVTAVPANVPLTATARNDPGFANPQDTAGGPAPYNVPTSPLPHKTIPTISPPNNPRAHSVTGAPATATLQQKVPQNRMKQSVDMPVRQQLRSNSPGMRARNVQSVTLI